MAAIAIKNEAEWLSVREQYVGGSEIASLHVDEVGMIECEVDVEGDESVEGVRPLLATLE